MVVLTHPELPVSDAPERNSVLSAHPIVVGSEAPDLVSDEDGGTVIDSSHKIGGRPYCIQEPELSGAKELFADGYLHVLQLDFPGPPDAVKGEWPFGGGLFNLFWRPPFEEQEYVWYLQA